MADRKNEVQDRTGATSIIFAVLIVLLLAWGLVARFAAPASLSAGIAVLLACHGAVGLGAWCATGRLLNRRASQSWCTVSLVLSALVYFACLGSLGLLLGSCHVLTPASAMGTAALVGLLLVWWGRSHASIAMPLLSRRPLLAVVQIATLLLVVLVAFKSALAPEYDYDVLTYHLMFPARWVQDGALSIVPTWFGDPAPAYAPSLTEVYYAWLMLPFHGDVLARCGQLPFYVLLLVGSAGVSAELRLPRTVRVWVPLVVGLVPSIMSQAATAMVDVALSAQLVCAVYFSLRCRVRRQSADLVGLILALGLLLGTKFIALPFGVALIPLLAYALWRRPKRGAFLRSWRLPVTLATLLALWVGGFWYVRNAWLTGNPLYPLETRIGKTVLFDGAYGREQMENSVFNLRKQTSGHAFGETLWGVFHLPFTRPQGTQAAGSNPVHQWHKGPAGALALACCLGVLGSLRTGRCRTRRGLFYLTGVLLFAAFWFVLPFQQSRFAFGIVSLAIVGSAGAVWLHPRANWVLLVLWIGLWTGTFGKEWQTWLSPIFGDAGRSEDPRLAAMQEPRWQTLQHVWQTVDEELRGVTIAYAGNNLPYFLCGRRLENRVLYVPAREPATGRFHDFAMLAETRALGRPNTSEPACDRYVMSPDEWCDNLRKLDVDYVLVTAMFPGLLPNYRHDIQGFPIERAWLDHLCRFQTGGQPFVERRVMGSGGAVLYKLNENAWPRRIEGLHPVRRNEPDALALFRREGIEEDKLTRLYPHAEAFIKRSGLTPLR